MNVREFIDNKSPQLSYYLRSYWQQELPYNELECFIWDTLEEWTQIENQATEAYSAKERIFWHVLQQAHYWQEYELTNEQIKPELEMCILHLEKDGLCPFAVVGIRP
ncbi:hypothetical protein [Glaciecola sp. KUL10]|uniref:hypothetical protein n=1 Tax=Glaciecola sp. (strain KUL10) TaxID=2161813 RepID=UPI000D78374A|nr:hypothetical protein [Glaciecola sp. KUL10]